MAKPFTEKEKDLMTKMRMDGASAGTIANRLGRPESSVKGWLTNNKIPAVNITDKRTERKAESEKCRKRRAKGDSLTQCIRRADQLGMSYGQYMASRQYQRDKLYI